ncbi:unnamed protein product, partial [Ectocarpus sp. 4 AP-2014]
WGARTSGWTCGDGEWWRLPCCGGGENGWRARGGGCGGGIGRAPNGDGGGGRWWCFPRCGGGLNNRSARVGGWKGGIGVRGTGGHGGNRAKVGGDSGVANTACATAVPATGRDGDVVIGGRILL